MFGWRFNIVLFTFEISLNNYDNMFVFKMKVFKIIIIINISLLINIINIVVEDQILQHIISYHSNHLLLLLLRMFEGM